MLKLIKVTGNSLLPSYKEGDYVMIVTIPFFVNAIQRGDIVVFRHPVYGTMIKKVARIDYNLIHVIGTHANSADSRQFGPIHRDDIIGKVIWHIPKPKH